MQDSAEKLAAQTGLGETFVGTLLLALVTGLPEVSTTVTAVRMGAFDLAVGNIFGSNAFNMLVLVPVDLFQPGSLLADVEPLHAVTAAATIIVTCVAALGLLYRAEQRFWIVEYDAAVMIALIVGAFCLIWLRGDLP